MEATQKVRLCMVLVRRMDDVSALPLGQSSLQWLRRLGINTVGALFDAPQTVLAEHGQARRLVSQMAAGNAELGLLEWGVELCARRGKLYWSLTEDGVLTVYGAGRMMDYTPQFRPPWDAFASEIRQVRLEEQVENVGAQAFAGCKALERVALSEAVRRIGAGAFRDCTALDAVECSAQIRNWRADGDGISAGMGAFANTPWQAGRWGDFCICGDVLAEYYGAETNVKIPEGVRRIAPMVFEGMPLETVTLPKTLERIDACAFRGTKLREVKLPKGVTALADWAFADIPTLERVVIGRNGMEVAETAFANTPVSRCAHPLRGRWKSLYALNPVEEPGINSAKALRYGPCPGRKIGVPSFSTRSDFLKRLNSGEMVVQIHRDFEQRMVDWVRAYYLHPYVGWMAITVYPCKHENGMVDVWRDVEDYLSKEDLQRCSLEGMRRPGKSLWYTMPYRRFSEYDKPFVLLDDWLEANPEYTVKSLESCYETDWSRLCDAC